MKRIVFFTLSPIPYGNNITDGSGFRIWGLANYLKKSNEVTILTLYNSYIKGSKTTYNTTQDGLDIREITYKPTSVAKNLRQIKPDVLIFSNWSSYVFASWFKRDIPVVMDYVGPSLMENLMFRRTNPAILSRLKLRSFNIADYMITTTERLRYYLLGSMIRSSRLRKYEVGDPIVQVVPIFPPSNPLCAVDENLGGSEGGQEFTMLLPGAIVPWYDYDTVLRALSRLKREGKKFKLIIMGEAAPSLSWAGGQGILRTCDDLGLTENIIVTGLVPFNQRGKFYLNADVGIVPNRNTLENDLSARVRVIDCLWGNLPMVTPGGDEYSEIALESGCAFRYSFNDSNSLLKVLTCLIDNRDALNVARKNITSLVSKKFNADALVKPFEKYIEASKPGGNRGALFSAATGLGPYLRNLAK